MNANKVKAALIGYILNVAPPILGGQRDALEAALFQHTADSLITLFLEDYTFPALVVVRTASVVDATGEWVHGNLTPSVTPPVSESYHLELTVRPCVNTIGAVTSSVAFLRSKPLTSSIPIALQLHLLHLGTGNFTEEKSDDEADTSRGQTVNTGRPSAPLSPNVHSSPPRCHEPLKPIFDIVRDYFLPLLQSSASHETSVPPLFPYGSAPSSPTSHTPQLSSTALSESKTDPGHDYRVRRLRSYLEELLDHHQEEASSGSIVLGLEVGPTISNLYSQARDSTSMRVSQGESNSSSITSSLAQLGAFTSILSPNTGSISDDMLAQVEVQVASWSHHIKSLLIPIRLTTIEAIASLTTPQSGTVISPIPSDQTHLLPTSFSDETAFWSNLDSKLSHVYAFIDSPPVRYAFSLLSRRSQTSSLSSFRTRLGLTSRPQDCFVRQCADFLHDMPLVPSIAPIPQNLDHQTTPTSALVLLQNIVEQIYVYLPTIRGIPYPAARLPYLVFLVVSAFLEKLIAILKVTRTSFLCGVIMPHQVELDLPSSASSFYSAHATLEESLSILNRISALTESFFDEAKGSILRRSQRRKADEHDSININPDRQALTTLGLSTGTAGDLASEANESGASLDAEQLLYDLPPEAVPAVELKSGVISLRSRLHQVKKLCQVHAEMHAVLSTSGSKASTLLRQLCAGVDSLISHDIYLDLSEKGEVRFQQSMAACDRAVEDINHAIDQWILHCLSGPLPVQHLPLLTGSFPLHIFERPTLKAALESSCSRLMRQFNTFLLSLSNVADEHGHRAQDVSVVSLVSNIPNQLVILARCRGLRHFINHLQARLEAMVGADAWGESEEAKSVLKTSSNLTHDIAIVEDTIWAEVHKKMKKATSLPMSTRVFRIIGALGDRAKPSKTDNDDTSITSLPPSSMRYYPLVLIDEYGEIDTLLPFVCFTRSQGMLGRDRTVISSNKHSITASPGYRSPVDEQDFCLLTEEEMNFMRDDLQGREVRMMLRRSLSSLQMNYAKIADYFEPLTLTEGTSTSISLFTSHVLHNLTSYALSIANMTWSDPHLNDVVTTLARHADQLDELVNALSPLLIRAQLILLELMNGRTAHTSSTDPSSAMLNVHQPSHITTIEYALNVLQSIINSISSTIPDQTDQLRKWVNSLNLRTEAIIVDMLNYSLHDWAEAMSTKLCVQSASPASSTSLSPHVSYPSSSSSSSSFSTAATTTSPPSPSALPPFPSSATPSFSPVLRAPLLFTSSTPSSTPVTSFVIEMGENGFCLEPSIEVLRELLNDDLNIVTAGLDALPKLSSKHVLASQHGVELGRVTITFASAQSKLSRSLARCLTAMESMINSVREWVSNWALYLPLWDLDINEATTKQPNLNEWESTLTTLRKKATSVRSPALYTFGRVTISDRPAYEIVVTKLRQLRGSFASSAMSSLSASLKALLTDITHARSKLETMCFSADNLDDTASAIVILRDIKNKITEWDTMSGDISRLYSEILDAGYGEAGTDVLTHHQEDIPDPINNLTNGMNYVKQALVKRLGELATEAPSLRDRIKTESEQAIKDATVIETRWAGLRQRLDAGEYNGMDEECKRLELAASEAKATVDQMNDVRSKLEMPRCASLSSAFLGLEDIAQAISRLAHVWKTAGPITAQLKLLDKQRLADVQAEDVVEEIKGLKDALVSPQDEVLNHPLYVRVEAALTKRQAYHRILADLKSPVLRIRHKHRLLELYHASLRERDVDIDEKSGDESDYSAERLGEDEVEQEWSLLRLTDVFSAPLEASQRIVKAVVAQAAGEGVIEHFIKKDLEDKWKEARFTFSSKQAGSSELQLMVIDNMPLLFDLVTHQASEVQSAKLSPNSTHFKQMLDAWTCYLNTAGETLEVLMNVQRRWLYMTGVFGGSADVHGCLAEEEKAFTQVNQTMNQFIHGMTEQPLAKPWLEKAMDVSTKMRHLQDTLIAIGKALDGYLSSERKLFPRYYFLGDQDLLDVIGSSSRPSTVLPHLSKMFPGIHSLLFLPPSKVSQSTSSPGSSHPPVCIPELLPLDAQGTIIAAVTSKEGEMLRLFQPVNVLRYKYTREWLDHLNYEVKRTICVLTDFAASLAKQHIRSAISHKSSPRSRQGHDQSTLRTLLLLPSQVALLAIQTAFTTAVESVLHTRQFGIPVSSGIEDSAVGRREEKIAFRELCHYLHAQLAILTATLGDHESSHHTRRTAGHLIVEFLHQLEVIESLSLATLQSVEWLRQPRFYITPLDVADSYSTDLPCEDPYKMIPDEAKRWHASSYQTLASPTAPGDLVVSQTPSSNDMMLHDTSFATMTVKLGRGEFIYDFDYQGASDRLIYTPLTERAYLVFAEALLMHYGGNPFGPAGTGKTETVKALGKLLGRHVIVTNCDEAIDVHAMQRVLMGLCHIGAWGCFDEINRLEERILSAIGPQVQNIQAGLRDRVKAVSLNSGDGLGIGDDLTPLHPNTALFLTMNLGYAGRSTLPESLVQLFRPVAMIEPDLYRIAYTSLYAQGFINAKDLAHSLVYIFSTLNTNSVRDQSGDKSSINIISEVEEEVKECLGSIGAVSAQSHYDFGLRSLKAILRTSNHLRKNHAITLLSPSSRTSATQLEFREEEALIVEALSFTLLPKLMSHDVPPFKALIRMVFPSAPSPSDQLPHTLEHALRTVAMKQGFCLTPEIIEKIMQISHSLAVQTGVIIVGNASVGKTSLLNMLVSSTALLYHGHKPTHTRFESDEKKHQSGVAWVPHRGQTMIHRIEPKSLTKMELFGGIDGNTGTWFDGIITCIVRRVLEGYRHWSDVSHLIVFDGEVDVLWVENLNSVLDDSHLLTLANGERLPVPSHIRFVFEVSSLEAVTPATITRCGIVYVPDNLLTHAMLVMSHLSKCLNELLPHLLPTTYHQQAGSLHNQASLSHSHLLHLLTSVPTLPVTRTLSELPSSDTMPHIPTPIPSATLIRLYMLRATLPYLANVPSLIHLIEHSRPYDSTATTKPAYLQQLIERMVSTFQSSVSTSSKSIFIVALSGVFSLLRANMVEAFEVVDQGCDDNMSIGDVQDYALRIMIKAIHTSLSAFIPPSPRHDLQAIMRSLHDDSGAVAPNDHSKHVLSQSHLNHDYRPLPFPNPQDPLDFLVPVLSIAGQPGWIDLRQRAPRVDLNSQESEESVCTLELSTHLATMTTHLQQNKALLICGPRGAGKCTLVNALISSQPHFRYLHITCGAFTTPQSLKKVLACHCIIVKTPSARYLRPKTPGTQLILHCEGIDSCPVDAYGAQPALSFLRSIIASKAIHSTAQPKEPMIDPEPLLVEDIHIICSSDLSLADAYTKLQSHFLSHLIPITLTILSATSLQAVCETIARRALERHQSYHQFITPLVSASLDVFWSLQPLLASLSLIELKRWMECLRFLMPRPTWGASSGLAPVVLHGDGSTPSETPLLTHPDSEGGMNMDDDKRTTELVAFWLHEGLRVLQDPCPEEDKRIEIERVLHDAALRYFPMANIKALPQPLLFCSLGESKIYHQVTLQEATTFLSEHLSLSSPEAECSSLIIHDNAVQNIIKLSRVLLQPSGHVIIAGPPGTGKTTFARRLVGICGYDEQIIRTYRGYIVDDLDRDLRRLLLAASRTSTKCVLIVPGFHRIDPILADRLGHLVSIEECCATLFQGDEKLALILQLKESLVQGTASAYRQTDDELYGAFVSRLKRNLRVVFIVAVPENSVGKVEQLDYFLSRFVSPVILKRVHIIWAGHWSSQAFQQVACQELGKLPMDTLPTEHQRGNSNSSTSSSCSLTNGSASPTNTSAPSLPIIAISLTEIYFSMMRQSQCINQGGEKDKEVGPEGKNEHKATVQVNTAGRSDLQYYVSPRDFLEHCRQFLTLYTQMQRNMRRRQRHIIVGVDTLASTNRGIEEMKGHLLAKHKTLKNKESEAAIDLDRMVYSRQEAENERKQVEAFATIIQTQEVEISQRKAQAEHALAKVQPALQQAKQDVLGISLTDLDHVSRFVNPPALVSMVIESVMVALGEKISDWNSMKAFLRRSDVLRRIAGVTPESLSGKAREVLSTKYLSSPDFNPERVGRAASACSSLAKWVIAMVNCSTILEQTEPLRREVEGLEEKLAKVKEESNEASRRQEDLGRQLDQYKESYARLVGEIESIKVQVKETEEKVDRASALLHQLFEERDRWVIELNSIGHKVHNLVGDCICLSAFLTYSGPFSLKIREEMMKRWRHVLEINGHTLSEVADLVPSSSPSLCSPQTRAQWSAAGFSSDTMCVENMIIFNHCMRYPLVIDPAGYALRFIKELLIRPLRARATDTQPEKLSPIPTSSSHQHIGRLNEAQGRDKTGVCVMASLEDNDFKKTLESCLRFGHVLLLEDIDTHPQLDPLLVPLLNNEVVRRNGRSMVPVGETLVDLSPSFTLVLCTHASSPRITSDLFSKVQVISFQATADSLQDMCLLRALRVLAPGIERRRSEVTLAQATLACQLNEAEETLLSTLTEVEGSILDNSSVFSQLERTKSEAVALSDRLKEGKTAISELLAATEAYHPFLKLCSQVFLTMDNLELLHPNYSFSLTFFLECHQRALEMLCEEDVQAGEQSIPTPGNVYQLSRCMLDAVLKRVSRSMYPEHRIAFAAHLAELLLTHHPGGGQGIDHVTQHPTAVSSLFATLIDPNHSAIPPTTGGPSKTTTGKHLFEGLVMLSEAGTLDAVAPDGKVRTFHQHLEDHQAEWMALVNRLSRTAPVPSSYPGEPSTSRQTLDIKGVFSTFPGEWPLVDGGHFTGLDALKRAVVAATIAPRRTPEILEGLIYHILGNDALMTPSHDIAGVLMKECNETTPLLLLAGAGTDIKSHIDTLVLPSINPLVGDPLVTRISLGSVEAEAQALNLLEDALASDNLDEVCPSSMSTTSHDPSSSSSPSSNSSQGSATSYGSSLRPHWIVLFNLHVALNLVPKLLTLLSRARNRESSKLTPSRATRANCGLRIIITAEVGASVLSPPRVLPTELLRASRVVLFETPQDFESAMERAYTSLMTRPIILASPQQAHLRFQLAFLHAYLMLRSQFAPISFTSSKSPSALPVNAYFSENDLAIAEGVVAELFGESKATGTPRSALPDTHHLTSSPQNAPRVSWAVLHGLLSDVAYGGRVSSTKDLMQLRLIVQHFMSPHLMSESRGLGIQVIEPTHYDKSHIHNTSRQLPLGLNELPSLEVVCRSPAATAINHGANITSWLTSEVRNLPLSTLICLSPSAESLKLDASLDVIRSAARSLARGLHPSVAQEVKRDKVVPVTGTGMSENEGVIQENVHNGEDNISILLLQLDKAVSAARHTLLSKEEGQKGGNSLGLATNVLHSFLKLELERLIRSTDDVMAHKGLLYGSGTFPRTIEAPLCAYTAKSCTSKLRDTPASLMLHGLISAIHYFIRNLHPSTLESSTLGLRPSTPLDIRNFTNAYRIISLTRSLAAKAMKIPVTSLTMSARCLLTEPSLNHSPMSGCKSKPVRLQVTKTRFYLTGLALYGANLIMANSDVFSASNQHTLSREGQGDEDNELDDGGNCWLSLTDSLNPHPLPLIEITWRYKSLPAGSPTQRVHFSPSHSRRTPTTSSSSSSSSSSSASPSHPSQSPSSSQNLNILPSMWLSVPVYTDTTRQTQLFSVDCLTQPIILGEDVDPDTAQFVWKQRGICLFVSGCSTDELTR